MGVNRALATAQAQLGAFLFALPPSTRFQVVFYNVSAEALPSTDADGLLPADAPTLARVNSLLPAVCVQGNTDHVRAFVRARLAAGGSLPRHRRGRSGSFSGP